jgi:FMN phosphatase YigB (HAD superfamily)
VSRFEAVLFDAGDTLIRLSGSGERLLHRAAAALGVERLDPDQVADVWQRVLARASTAEEMAKGRDLSTTRHREVWIALYDAAGCADLAPGLSEELYSLTVRADSWEAFPDTAPTLRALRERGLRLGVVSDTGFDLRPAVSVFRTASEQLGVKPERTLMVGDNPLTDSGAVAAGMYVFLLPPPSADGPRGLGHILSLV